MSKCCFCGKEVEYKVNGNDPRPIRVKGEEMPICCNECNARIVVPTRVVVWGVEKELKEKLAEKDSAEQGKYQNVLELTKMCTKKDKQIEQLKQQLAEKEKEIEDMKIDLEAKDFNINTLMEQRKRKQKFYNQSKIEFAVEQLEQVRQEIAVKDKIGLRLFIDGKIKEIREIE